MRDEEALKQRSDRANRFARFWDEDGISVVCETWEKQLSDALVNAPAGEQTERLKTAIQMGRKFREWFMSVVRDGEIARKQMEDIQKGRRPYF